MESFFEFEMMIREVLHWYQYIALIQSDQNWAKSNVTFLV